LSAYLGSYSSSISVNGLSQATAGDTSSSNVNMIVDAANFTSCSAINNAGYGNAYGGSLSIYVGAFTSSSNSIVGPQPGGLIIMTSISTVTTGSTIASGVRVSISHSSYFNCSVASILSTSYPENSYGGSLSVVIGANDWSTASGNSASSSSASSAVCGATNTTGLVVYISNSTFAASSATSASILSALVCFLSSSLFNAAQPPQIGGSNVSTIDISTLPKTLFVVHSMPTDVWPLCRCMAEPSA
jgi:hypothetical protein